MTAGSPESTRNVCFSLISIMGFGGSLVLEPRSSLNLNSETIPFVVQKQTELPTFSHGD